MTEIFQQKLGKLIYFRFRIKAGEEVTFWYCLKTTKVINQIIFRQSNKIATARNSVSNFKHLR